MLIWAVLFILIAVAAAAIGFGGVVITGLTLAALGVAKVLFVAFLVLAGLALLVGRRRIRA